MCAVRAAGQSILRQGQEVTDIHFVLQGTVHLTYSAVATKAAARAAARASVNGALPTAPAAPAAAAGGTAPRITSGGRFSGLAQALRLEQTCFDAPVVLATRWATAHMCTDSTCLLSLGCMSCFCGCQGSVYDKVAWFDCGTTASGTSLAKSLWHCWYSQLDGHPAS